MHGARIDRIWIGTARDSRPRTSLTEPEVFPLDQPTAVSDHAASVDISRPPRATAEPDARRWKLPNKGLIITLAVSLGLHAAAVTGALWLLPPAVPLVATPAKPAEVELVMVEHKGDLAPTAAPAPAQPTPPTPRTEAKPPDQSKAAEASKAPPTPPDQPKAPEIAKTAPTPPAQPNPAEASPTAVPATPPPVQARPDEPQQTAAPPRDSEPDAAKAQETTAQEAKPASDATQSARAAEPATPAEQSEPAASASTAEPAPPAAQPAATISLSGTDSPSEARAFGARIIPASPDAVFHNRPPVFPDEAARDGEHGTVVVVIHVSPAGTAAGVDLVRSSGYVLLDRAAREAVMRWRFLPAVKDGQPVASDMTMGFEFDNE